MKNFIALAVFLMVVTGAVLFFIPKKSNSPKEFFTNPVVETVYRDDTGTRSVSEIVVNENGDKEVTLGATGQKVVLEKIVIEPNQEYTFTFNLCGQDIEKEKIVAVYKCPKGPMPDGTMQYRDDAPDIHIIDGEIVK